jgi:hypothetical protein
LTEQAPPPPRPGPLHPATRLGRVLQQIRSFTTLHAAELDGVAGELEAAGQTELATRLRAYRDLHTQEAGRIIDELTDVRAELETEARSDASTKPEPSEPPPVGSPPSPTDPAAASPKRARWLAEQARHTQRPRSRRDLFLRPNE